MTSKPILCLDFDGVLHSYISGWKGAHFIPDPPTPGAMAFLVEAVKHFEVAIYSSRSGQEGGLLAMQTWVDYWLGLEYGWDKGADVVAAANNVRNNVKYPTEKPPARVTIDDRALTFSGNWADYDMPGLLAFKPWNKREAPPTAPRDAIANLFKNQRQLDPDGIDVGVSREALEEVLNYLGAIRV